MLDLLGRESIRSVCLPDSTGLSRLLPLGLLEGALGIQVVVVLVIRHEDADQTVERVWNEVIDVFEVILVPRVEKGHQLRLLLVIAHTAPCDVPEETLVVFQLFDLTEHFREQLDVLGKGIGKDVETYLLSGGNDSIGIAEGDLVLGTLVSQDGHEQDGDLTQL